MPLAAICAAEPNSKPNTQLCAAEPDSKPNTQLCAAVSNSKPNTQLCAAVSNSKPNTQTYEAAPNSIQPNTQTYEEAPNTMQPNTQTYEAAPNSVQLYEAAPANTAADDYTCVQDEALLIRADTKAEIIKNCRELKEKARISFLIKTAKINRLSEAQGLVDAFFSTWVRSIGPDKRGILIYVCLPEGASHGKVFLRVGIGLKYLISREMGEKILNQVIVPNNAANNDGLGFLEGVLSIKRMLLDELKRDPAKTASMSAAFNPFSFLWASKEIIFVVLICAFLCYAVFFVERCPRCNGVLKVTSERLKEPGAKTLGLQRKIYTCERCGFSRRKKEPLYPPGKAGWVMRLTGRRRNVKIG